MYLGEDVLFQILVLLPVRTLLRLRCVCKGWCALIKSCDFQNAYLALRRASAVDDQLVRLKLRCLSHDRLPACTIRVTPWFDDYKAMNAQSALASPTSSSCSDVFELSGTYSALSMNNHVDGILCLCVNWFDIILVNPALRETRKISLPTFNFGVFFNCVLGGYGFGYGYEYRNDAVRDTVYKVVAVVFVYEVGSLYPCKRIAFVYHLNTHSWKILGEISALASPFDYIASSGCIFSHGAVHWHIRTHHSDAPQVEILAFDMTNESFRVIQFPPGRKYCTLSHDYGAMDAKLFSVDKSTIAFVSFVYSPNARRCNYDVQQQIQVWVMKEYGNRDSWTLQYSINSLPETCWLSSFWKKDKLLLNTMHGPLVCYDLLKGQLDEKLELHTDNQWQYRVTGHETLVSVKQVPGGGGGYIVNPGDYEALQQSLAESDGNGNGRWGAPPASKEAVDALETVEIKEGDVWACPVCNHGINFGKMSKILPCEHGYHGKCIAPWLRARNTCPVCRYELPTDDPDYEEERKKKTTSAAGCKALRHCFAIIRGNYQRGASKEAVVALETARIKEKGDVWACTVCGHGNDFGEMSKILPCGHGFHGNCIAPWLCVKNTCPVCRCELPTDDQEERKKKTASAAVLQVQDYAMAAELVVARA